MNEEELPEVQEVQKTEMIVEQSDIDKVFSFPVFEQITNMDKNTKEIMEAIQKQNEYLLPTEEELLQMEADALEAEELEALEEIPVEELTEEEILLLEEQEALALSETEITVEYLPKIHQEMVLQNEKMDEYILLQQDSNAIGIESSLMVSLSIMAVMGVKIFIDQITKW